MARTRRSQRVSDHYQLHLTQPSLEFLDVYIEQDTPLYVDPRAFLALRTPWADACVSLIHGFFDEVIGAMHLGDADRARYLLQGLREPNETRLGMSAGKPAGRGVGAGLADDLYESLRASEAVSSGLIERLEDTALLVPGVGVDRISDITTNVVRSKLIEFTQQMAAKYGMKLLPAVDAGATWSSGGVTWQHGLKPALAPLGKPLLLVPKTVVRWRLDYDPGQYYRHLLRFLRDYELSQAQSPLVSVIRSGKRRGVRTLTIKRTAEHYHDHYGKGQKTLAVRATRDFPHAFEQFKAERDRRFRPPETIEFLADKIGVPTADWTGLLSEVLELSPGREGATQYHRAIQALVSPLFAPGLVDPQLEQQIGQGTKRIDILYRNMASGGFFRWFGDHFARSPWVPIECKNFSDDPQNPEIAQIAGRLNRHRGLLGLLVCRRIADWDRFNQRCRQELNDNNRYIIGLDDGDLKELVAARQASDDATFFKLLSDKVQDLVD